MPKETWVDAPTKLEDSLVNISPWMRVNVLVLNEEKTELIILLAETSTEGK